MFSVDVTYLDPAISSYSIAPANQVFLFGPFAERPAAEECVILLSSRNNVESATIRQRVG
jgi:hypothetical protein